eukprot:m.82685 g.82685  ORF g.82685 m.82685 type:complete len:302 (+) comp8130_c0_seq2:81-986(+)
MNWLKDRSENKYARQLHHAALHLGVQVVLDDLLQKLRVAGIQPQIGRDGDPLDRSRIIARSQLEVLRQLARLVMEVNRNRLHPRIVCVAWVVHVALVHQPAVLEELLNHRLCICLLRVAQLHCVERLLTKLALERHRHLVPSIDHAPGNCPLAVVPALDAHKLQHLVPVRVAHDAVGVSLPSRDDGVRSVVRPEAAQKATATQAGATVRVARVAIDQLVAFFLMGAPVYLAVHGIEVQLAGLEILRVIRPHRLRRDSLVLVEWWIVCWELLLPGHALIGDGKARGAIQIWAEPGLLMHHGL